MPPRRRPRVTLSFRVERVLADRLREFVRDRAGKPMYLSMSTFIEGAIEAHMRALDEQLADAERGRHRLLGENTHPRKS